MPPPVCLLKVLDLLDIVQPAVPIAVVCGIAKSPIPTHTTPLGNVSMCASK